MEANLDFRDLLQSLLDEGVRFLVVGGYAVMYHTEPRFTKDLDVWTEPSPANVHRLWRALAVYGAPLSGLSEAAFADERVVFQMGLPPNRIDILMGVEGVDFQTAWSNRVISSYAGVPMPVLAEADLIRAKKAAGRPQDLLDVKNLLAARRKRQRRKRK